MKETITLRLDGELMENLRKDALKDNRSINNYIETLLKRHYQDDEKEKEKPGE